MFQIPSVVRLPSDLSCSFSSSEEENSLSKDIKFTRYYMVVH